uniref:Uncharacterized protein n=2 Tax=Cacopsylla melanoneura TaxID=428564 RepID=A0A8D9DXN6_9HEMI
MSPLVQLVLCYVCHECNECRPLFNEFYVMFVTNVMNVVLCSALNEFYVMLVTNVCSHQRQIRTAKRTIRARHVWFFTGARGGDVLFHVSCHSELVESMIRAEDTPIVECAIISRQTLAKFAMIDDGLEQVGQCLRAMTTGYFRLL